VSARDLDAFLAGTWTVDRTVRDASGGRDAAFTGVAEFAREGGSVAWRETGRLRLDRYDGPASRELALVHGDGGWEVRFADGRPFHPLDLSGGRWTCEHACGRDLYAGEFDVLGPDELEVRWRVRGPAKDQEIVSRYRRRRPPVG
jgi:hypothetical protein